MITETLDDNTQKRKRDNDTEEKEGRNERDSLFVKDRRVRLRWLPGSPPCCPETMAMAAGLGLNRH